MIHFFCHEHRTIYKVDEIVLADHEDHHVVTFEGNLSENELRRVFERWLQRMDAVHG